MSTPVRHHFTPQFYLGRWCKDDGLLCVVRRFGTEIKSYRRAPKAVGFKNNLYSFSDTYPTDDIAALETDLLSPLDNAASAVVGKLIANETLTPEERRLWAVFLAGMRARTPESVELIKRTWDGILSSEMQAGQAEYESLRTDDDPATLLEWVESRYPGLAENLGLMNMTSVLRSEAVNKIQRMSWHPLDFAASPHRLLCSDRPCVFTAGLDDPDCVIGLPLSPTNGFIAFNPGSRAQAALMQHGPRVIAAALNHNVVQQAKSEAYSLGAADAPRSFYQRYLRDSAIQPETK